MTLNELPLRIAPYANDFNRLEKNSCLIILEYGNDIERAKKEIDSNIEKLYEAGYDKQDAHIARELSYHYDAKDFLDRIK